MKYRAIYLEKGLYRNRPKLKQGGDKDMNKSIIIGTISLVLISLFIGCGGESIVQVITTPTGTAVTATPTTGTGATATPTATGTGGSDGVYTQSGGTVSQSDKSYNSTVADISAVTIDNSGTFTMTDSTVTKSGNTSSGDNSSFYGRMRVYW
jgi:hypothetical protein